MEWVSHALRELRGQTRLRPGVRGAGQIIGRSESPQIAAGHRWYCGSVEFMRDLARHPSLYILHVRPGVCLDRRGAHVWSGVALRLLLHCMVFDAKGARAAKPGRSALLSDTRCKSPQSP